MAAVLEFRLTGGSSNTNPNNSLGGVMSDHNPPTTAMNNLFDNINPTEASNGDNEYRALDIYNSGDASGEVVKMWIASQTSSGGTGLKIAYDTTTKDGSDVSGECHTPSWSGELIADEGTAPTYANSGFTQHLSGNKLTIPSSGKIPPQEAVRVWVKREVDADTSNTGNDQATLSVEFA